MGAAGEIHLERPGKPDGWMLYEGARIRKPCSGEMTVFPSIQTILHNFRTLRRNKAHEECIRGSTKHPASLLILFHSCRYRLSQWSAFFFRSRTKSTARQMQSS